jgi:hypothetical protein
MSPTLSGSVAVMSQLNAIGGGVGIDLYAAL